MIDSAIEKVPADANFRLVQGLIDVAFTNRETRRKFQHNCCHLVALTHKWSRFVGPI